MTITAHDDNEGPPSDDDSALHRQRAERILRYVSAPERTGQWLRHYDVQAALGITSTHAYGEAFALARKLARAQGQNIVWNRLVDGQSAFCHVTPESEQGRWYPGARTRSAAISSQVTNLVDDLNWGAKYAGDSLQRLWAQTNATSYNMVVTMAEQMRRLASEIDRQRSATGTADRPAP